MRAAAIAQKAADTSTMHLAEKHQPKRGTLSGEHVRLRHVNPTKMEADFNSMIQSRGIDINSKAI